MVLLIILIMLLTLNRKTCLYDIFIQILILKYFFSTSLLLILYYILNHLLNLKYKSNMLLIDTFIILFIVMVKI